MRATAGEAVQTAFQTLKDLTDFQTQSEDDEVQGHAADTRLKAATELGRLALQILTKTKSGGEEVAKSAGKAGSQRDLFDKPRDMGPWKLALAAVT